MSAARTVRVEEPRGLTLDDLEDFVRSARDAGVKGNEPLRADVRGRDLTELTAEIA